MATPGERLAKMEEAVESMEHRLFGNGQKGILAIHDERIAAIKEALSRLQWIGIGVFITWSFLTGSGTVSLESLLKLLSGGGK